MEEVATYRKGELVVTAYQLHADRWVETYLGKQRLPRGTWIVEHRGHVSPVTDETFNKFYEPWDGNREPQRPEEDSGAGSGPAGDGGRAEVDA